jgi:transposase
MRARICELRSIGWSYRKIQERHSIPLSTIVSTIKREHDRVGQKSKPRSGAPKAITQEERDRMAEKLKLDPNITWKDLSKECENASVTTVRKLMSEFRRR